MFIHLNGITQHVRQDGPPGAAPLVLLHSLGTSGAIFDPIMPALAARFNVIRPDLRGHGLSAVTPGPYSMSLFARIWRPCSTTSRSARRMSPAFRSAVSLPRPSPPTRPAASPRLS
jgi:pimeloyl-ACP methyl ester carboxylesterase